MFLKRLTLRNVRSIRALDLGFSTGEENRRWTYILGENGAGKSSVLKAIGLVMAGADALYELVGEPDDWIRLGETEAAIEVEFAPLSGEHRRAALTFRRGEKVFDFIERNRETIRQLDEALSKSERNYFVVAYGVTRKPAADERSAFSSGGSRFRTRRARAMATLFSGDASLVPLEQWAMDLDYRQGEGGLNAVRTALDNLLPDVTFSHIDKERRRLMFETPDGVLPFSALSDGYQAMAAWCGDLLWQITETFEDYNDPLSARGLLLVDELDLHLHPVWQRRLVSFLQTTLPRVQVVVTTHSPLTVHQAGAGELFVLHRGPNGVTASAYEGAPNRLMLHQLLQSPLFGLETLDSPQVEALRTELRTLTDTEAAGSADDGDRSRLKRVQAELADVPSWRETQPYLQRTNAVLEELAAVLTSGGDEGGRSPIQQIGTQPGRKRSEP